MGMGTIMWQQASGSASAEPRTLTLAEGWRRQGPGGGGLAEAGVKWQQAPVQAEDAPSQQYRRTRRMKAEAYDGLIRLVSSR